MEQTPNFIPVFFIILLFLSALLAPVFYIRSRRAKKAELMISEKAEKDLEELKEDCLTQLKKCSR
jgi:hypothetical protein